MNIVRRFVQDESAEDLIEYGLLLAFVTAVAIALIGGSSSLRQAAKNVFQPIARALRAASQ